MTVTRLAAIRGVGPGARGRAREGSAPARSNLAHVGASPYSRSARPLLNVAGGGGRGLAAHAGGVHGLGGDEV